MKILLAYFRLPSVRTAALIYFLIAGFLTQVPLFDYLGYEFSAAMTIPAALISGLLTIGFIRVHMRQPISRRKFLRVLTDYYSVSLILLLIPLAVMALNAVTVKNCSFAQGLQYFALLPGVTAVFSVSLGAPMGVIFRRARLIFVAAVVIILFRIVVVTYTEPQLFAYNAVMGFFPGITYDEALSDMSTLLLYREFTIVASLLFVVLFFLSVRMFWPDYKFYENVQAFRVRRGDRVLYSAVVICVSLLMYGYVYRNDMGFQYTASDIQQRLGGRTATPHFLLYYSPSSMRGGDVELLKAEAEYHYGVVVSRMKEPLRAGEKISVYVYPTADVKRRFIGSATTNITKPWRKEMHITLDSFEDTFRHELVHVLAAAMGLPLIRASARMALNEGLATAVDWRWGKFSPHEYSAAIQRERLLGDPEELFGYTGFATQQSSYAYVVTGSFARYLVDRFGLKAFKSVFPSAHFVESYGMTLHALIEDWKLFLKTVDASSLPGETVKTLFAQQSIFRKTCARVTAERNARGVRAMRAGAFAEAEREFSASFDDTQTPSALSGLLQTLLSQKKYGLAVETYERLHEASVLRYNPGILFLFADALWLEGDFSRSIAVFHRIEAMNYSETYGESAALRCLIVREPDLKQPLSGYFYGAAPDTVRSAIVGTLPQTGEARVVAKYLQAQDLLRRKRYAQAGDAFRVLVPALPGGVLSYACTFNGARAFYRARKFEEAKGLFWEAQNFAQLPSEASQCNEWIERCDAVAAQLE